MTIVPMIPVKMVVGMVGLDRPSAERLDKRIRLLVGQVAGTMTKLYDLVEEAKRHNIHETLGFPSWTAYVADVITVGHQLGPEQRRELVAYLSGEGMSQHGIAKSLDVGVGTVNRDLAESPVPNGTPAPVTGLDGKTYQRKPKPAKPEPGTIRIPDNIEDAKVELERLDEVITTTNAAIRVGLRELIVLVAEKVVHLDEEMARQAGEAGDIDASFAEVEEIWRAAGYEWIPECRQELLTIAQDAADAAHGV